MEFFHCCFISANQNVKLLNFNIAGERTPAMAEAQFQIKYKSEYSG